MTYPVQAADICLYCLNWGFRLPGGGMNEPVREEIRGEFVPWLNQLKFGMDKETEEGKFRIHGIVYVPNPYERSQK